MADDGVQSKLDALVARASTLEPTEEARTSAWIAIKIMQQHGGAIRLGPRAREHAPERGAPHARSRPVEEAWSVARASAPMRCWSCKEQIREGEQYAQHPRRSAVCLACFEDVKD